MTEISPMIKRTAIYFVSAIILLSSILWTSLSFAERTFELTLKKKVTPEHINELTANGLNADQINNLKIMVSKTDRDVEINVDKTMKIPDFVSAELAFPKGITKAEEQGYYYFEEFRKLYRMKAPRKELKVMKIKANNLGQHVKYQQYYNGIRVVGAEMLVHIKPGNKLWFMQGKYIPDITIDTTPKIKDMEAQQIVKAHYIAKNGADKEFTASSPELAIFNRWILDRSFEDRNILIWIAVATETRTGRTWTYYIDALTGEVLDVMDSARFIDSEIWDRQNTSDESDDELWYEDNIKTGAGTPDPETADLNTYTTEYWNYLLNTFGVYSINSASSPPGMQLVGNAYSVDMTCANACWDCINDQAIFCEEWVTHDLVGHEFTHGLEEYSSSDFVRIGESGALQESFADVFAEFFGCRMGTCDWMLEAKDFGHVKPLRDLSNPLSISNNQQPDHTGNTGNPFTDHPLFNSSNIYNAMGVPNIVAYLIVNGTQPDNPHYGYHIKGIGLSKAEQIYYSTLINTGMTSTANFIDARNVMVNVCNAFASSGTYGITQADCCQVKNAWKSVGVGNSCSGLGGTVSGTLDTERSPWFITDNVIIPAGSTLTVDPNVDVYIFPNKKIEALGTLNANGSTGDIRFLRSSDNTGIKINSQSLIHDGGEIKMPVNTYVSTDTKPRELSFLAYSINSFIRVDEDISISDVNVTLNITHEYDDRVRIRLESPTGTTLVLLEHIGLDGDNFINTTLDDEASISIDSGTAPFTGSFRPQYPLNRFDGENARGYWKLLVYNASGYYYYRGILESWSITFNSN